MKGVEVRITKRTFTPWVKPFTPKITPFAAFFLQKN